MLSLQSGPPPSSAREPACKMLGRAIYPPGPFDYTSHSVMEFFWWHQQ